MDRDDFEIISHERGWNGYFKLDIYELRHTLFQGGTGPIVRREILERGQAAAVLPYDPILDRVVLLEQFRPGAISVNAQDPTMPLWLNEIAAGIIEEGETSEDVAHRETLEETGCKIIGPLELIARYYTTPGCSSETVTMYYGPVDSTKAEGIHGVAEEGENIRVYSKSAQECFDMLTEGKLNNGTAIIAIQWLMLNRDRLRHEAAIKQHKF